jgi:hypothetical protein
MGSTRNGFARSAFIDRTVNFLLRRNKKKTSKRLITKLIMKTSEPAATSFAEEGKQSNLQELIEVQDPLFSDSYACLSKEPCSSPKKVASGTPLSQTHDPFYELQPAKRLLGVGSKMESTNSKYSWSMSGMSSIEKSMYYVMPSKNEEMYPYSSNPPRLLLSSSISWSEEERDSSNVNEQLYRNAENRREMRSDARRIGFDKKNKEYHFESRLETSRDRENYCISHVTDTEDGNNDIISRNGHFSEVSPITCVSSGSSTVDNLKMKKRILEREIEGMFQHINGLAQVPTVVTTRKMKSGQA